MLTLHGEAQESMLATFLHEQGSSSPASQRVLPSQEATTTAVEKPSRCAAMVSRGRHSSQLDFLHLQVGRWSKAEDSTAMTQDARQRDNGLLGPSHVTSSRRDLRRQDSCKIEDSQTSSCSRDAQQVEDAWRELVRAG